MSINFAFFNGDVKRDRRQEAVLNSLNERNDFLKKLEEMSEYRNLEGKKKNSAILIQKEWRRHMKFMEVKNSMRQEFDAISSIQNKSKNDISRMLNIICVMYQKKIDESRLITALSEAVKLSRENADLYQKEISDNRKFLLARCCIKFMETANAQTNFFMVFRFLEAFIVPDIDLMEKCSTIGYFEAQLHLLEAICDPKPSTISDQLPSARCQQLLNRIFAPFDERSNYSTSHRILKSFVNAICTYSNDFLFINCIKNQFNLLITSRNRNFYVLLECVKEISLKLNSLKSFDLKMAKWKLCVLIVEQSNNCSNNLNDSLISSYFDSLASVIGNLDNLEWNDDMETPENEVLTHLKSVSDTVLDSAHFRRIAHSYASNSSLNVSNVVTLQKQFLLIVDTLAASDNFMKSLLKFVLKYVQPSGKFDVKNEIEKVKTSLILMCTCLRKRVSSVADSEFDHRHVIDDLFSVLRLLRNVCINLTGLVHPDFPSLTMSEVKERKLRARKMWHNVHHEVVATLQTFYEKDMRVHFLHEGFWSEDAPTVLNIGNIENSWRRSRGGRSQEDGLKFVEQLKHAYDSDSSDDEDESENNLSPAVARNLEIMRNIPFIVPFKQRIKIFSQLISHDQHESGIGDVNDLAGFFSQRSGYSLTVRRDHLYNDTFEVLAPKPGVRSNMDLRRPIRVQMVNWTGNNEEGVDGGGIFREFLNEVLKEGFDVNRGLFMYTPSRLLYPNPSAHILFGADYYRHYQFLGRMLGKLIYAKQLIELRFSEFFLSQLMTTNRGNKDVDLQHMKSFDPVVFKNLRSMLDMKEEELKTLELDFSVIINDLDVIKTVNLKPNGSQIRVTTENVHEYVRLYVNYHLRIRMAPMVDAIRKGVSEVVSIDWLSMFSSSEIQNLIAGTEEIFSIEEMRKHCMCTNIRNSSDEEYIQMFWEVTSGLSSDDKKALLKFITGCSRPPIEGFQHIYPALGIVLVPDDNLLPSSATCMNLLKLPIYSSRERLEEKLRYAINSNAGFELM